MIIAVFWIGLLGATAVVLMRSRAPGLPVTPIAKAPDAALVRLRGKVVGDMELRAPLSRRPCTYYWADVIVSSMNKRKRWRLHDGRPFAIADETGRATIPTARFDVPHDRMEMVRASKLSASTTATLERLGVQLPEIAEVTIYEGVIVENEVVEVTGAGMRRVVAGADDVRERGFRDMPVGVFELSGDIHVLGERRPVRTLQ